MKKFEFNSIERNDDLTEVSKAVIAFGEMYQNYIATTGYLAKGFSRSVNNYFISRPEAEIFYSPRAVTRDFRRYGIKLPHEVVVSREFSYEPQEFEVNSGSVDYLKKKFLLLMKTQTELPIFFDSKDVADSRSLSSSFFSEVSEFATKSSEYILEFFESFLFRELEHQGNFGLTAKEYDFSWFLKHLEGVNPFDVSKIDGLGVESFPLMSELGYTDISLSNYLQKGFTLGLNALAEKFNGNSKNLHLSIAREMDSFLLKKWPYDVVDDVNMDSFKYSITECYSLISKHCTF